MFRSCAFGLVAAVGFAAPASAVTTVFGVDIEDYPIFFVDGSVTWESDPIDATTTFNLNPSVSPSLVTGPGNTTEIVSVDGIVRPRFRYTDFAPVQTGSLYLDIDYRVGPIFLPSDVIGGLTHFTYSVTDGVPKLEMLYDITTPFVPDLFENLFGDTVYVSIVLDQFADPLFELGQEELERLFLPFNNDIGSSDLNFGFMSMYKVKPSGENEGGGGGGGISPVPLPASIPLLLAGLGAFALVRRRA